MLWHKKKKKKKNDATEQLVHAFVTSRLDMGNSLLYGLPALQIKRLSRLQNIALELSHAPNQLNISHQFLEIYTGFE